MICISNFPIWLLYVKYTKKERNLYFIISLKDKRIVKPFQLKLIFIGARYDEFQVFAQNRIKKFVVVAAELQY